MKVEEKKNKLIKEQDLACFYMVNYSDIVLEDYSQDPYIRYNAIDKYYFQHMELLEDLSTKNLFHLLTKVEDDSEKRKIISDLIMNRAKEGDFFVEDIDNEFFMKPFFSATMGFNKLGTDNTN